MIVLPLITKVSLRRVADSLGRPTVEATVFSRRAKAAASTPLGTSVGKHEAVFAPKPVSQLIVEARRQVAPKLEGAELDVREADSMLSTIDGTRNFSKIGAAVSTAVSAAVAKLAAKTDNLELYEYLNPRAKHYKLPRLLCKMIGGGAHSRVQGAPSFQEFLAAPQARSFAQSVAQCRALYRRVGKALEAVDGFRGQTDAEGGWTGAFTDRKALAVLNRTVKQAREPRVGIDAAGAGGTGLPELCEEYGLFYVEDPFHDQAFTAFARFRRAFSGLTCADDLVATSPERLKRAIHLKACGAVIIKPNQAGLLSKTCEAVRLAEKHGVVPVPSHRSGETCDETIAHLSVAFSCPFIKLSLAGRERWAKIRELLRIERHLGR